MFDKPHLVLNWTFDVPNYRLFIKIILLEYETDVFLTRVFSINKDQV
jgi:hypothetical protein